MLPRAIRPLLLIAVLLAVPATAKAAVTTTAITSPIKLYDAGDYTLPSTDPVNQRTVSGTSDGAPGDAVKLICRRGPGSVKVLPATTVGAGGAWTLNYGVDQIAGSRCRMAVVPSAADAGTVDLTPFTGPVVFAGALDRSRYTAGANTGTLYDFYWESGRPGVFNDYDSISSCGLCDTKLVAEDGTLGSKYLWYDNAAAYQQHNAEGAARPYLKVDGVGTYFPTAARNILSGGPAGMPAMTVAATQDPATGDVTITTDEPTTRCGAFPPAPENCGTYTAGGVAVKRTIVEDEGGRRVRITDEWRSTDGQAHAVDVDMDEYPQSNGNLNGLRFPGDADYGPAGAAMTTRSGFTGITTVGLKSNRTAATGLDNPAGTVTMLPAPSQALFSGSTSGFIARHLIAVPATGAATVKRIYVISDSDTALDAATTRARDLIEGPTVALDALPATVTTAALTVTGTATDAVGVASVSVAGGAATLSGSAFSRALTLTPGVNTITVVAADAAGNTDTKTASVTYTPPVVAPPPPVVVPPAATKKPTFAKRGKPAVKTVRGVTTLSLGQQVACPAGTVSCVTRIAVKAGKVGAGATRITTKAGRTTVLKVKLSRKAARTLRTKRKLTIRVTITAKAGRGTATKTLTLTLRR